MGKLIYTSFSPNTRFLDLLLNKALVLMPWGWRRGGYPRRVASFFEKNFPNSQAFTFNYARSGMYLLFKSLGASEDDEVLIQGYTCVAAVNPIKWAGMKVTYVDVDPKTGNMNIEDLKDKLSDKTKAIMFQYTYGSSKGLDEVARLCKEKNILLIEDCTNSILGKHKGEFIGSFGDASIFSFGRDKAVSGVNGGVILINNKELTPNFKKEYDKIGYPSVCWTFKELIYPVIWWFIKLFFNIKVGKAIHFLFTKLGLLPRATSEGEKKGKLPKNIPAKLPSSLACLAFFQLKDIERLNSHRVEILKVYERELGNFDTFFSEEGNVLLRFSLKVDRRDELVKFLRTKNIYVGDWYDTPIAPRETDLPSVGYSLGMCPQSEEIGKKIINLPTHVNVSEKDAEFVVKSIKEFYGN